MLVHTEKVDDLRDHAGNRLQLILFHQIGLHVNPDHDLRTQLAGHVCREIIQYTPINQYPVTRSHRGKHARNGHARPHRLHEIPSLHHDLFPVEHICRHAGERDRQLQEIKGIMITDREIGKEIIHVLPADKTRRTLLPPVKREGKQVLAILFLLPERQVITIHFIT